MKKTLLTLVAALAVLCCFVGCGGADAFKGSYWIPEHAAETTYDAYVAATTTDISIVFKAGGKVVWGGDTGYKYKVNSAGTAEISVDAGLAGAIANAAMGGSVFTFTAEGLYTDLIGTEVQYKRVDKN